MPKHTWLSAWHLIVDELSDWALLLLGVVVICAIIILIWRRSRKQMIGRPGSRGTTHKREEIFDGRPLLVERPEDSADAAETNDRALGWRPLYSYMKDRRFTKWKPDDLSALVDEESCPLTTKLFISHRWETADDPDPDNKTLPTVIEYLSRVYMAANGFLDANSYLVKELVIGDNLRDAFHEQALHRCTCGSIGWLDVRNLLAPDDLFYERVVDIHRRRAFYRLLKHVRVWYDYTSLPQARETTEERALFDRALNRLADIVSRSEVLALWGIESVNRAWCLFEVLAGKKVHFCAPSQANFDFTLKAMMKASGYEDLAEYRGRPSQNIMIHVNSFRSSVADLNEEDIEAYLRDHGIDCSKDEDFSRTARLIHQYLRGYENAP